MLSPDFVILTGVAYVGLLFLIAWVSEKHADGSYARLLRSPAVYTLSISVYCTSWTFYGAVGTAARSGLEFLAIYMGPTIVFVGWWFLLRKLIRISHAQRITSIADFLSSRFGKSSHLAVLVTLIAVVTITPYIALQLKAITTSIQAVSVAKGGEDHLARLDELTLAFGVAVGMALFTILFGTRNVDAREQHPGVVAAIAFEAVVKLIALLAVGVFVVFALGGGMSDIFSRAVEAGLDIHEKEPLGSRWLAVLVLSGCAVICLPRQFQITVVENANENHLRTAGWAFPAYLMLMSLFEPRHVRPDIADVGGIRRLGLVRLYWGVFQCHLNDHRCVDSALDHGVEPRHPAAGASGRAVPGGDRGTGHCTSAPARAQDVDRRDALAGLPVFLVREGF